MSAVRLTKIDELADAAGHALAYAADGHRWVSVEALRVHLGRDSAIERVVPVEAGRIVGTPCFDGTGQVYAPPFVLSPDGSKLAAPFGDVEAQLARDQHLPPRASYTLRAAAISDDGAVLFAAGSYRPPVGLRASGARPASQARLLRLSRSGGAAVLEEHAHGEGPDRLALGKTRLAAAGDDLALYDAASGHRIATLAGHTGAARALAFSRDGAQLASGGADGQVLVWNAHDGARRGAAALSSEPISALAYSPDGKLLAVTGWDDQLRIVDAAAPAQVLTTLALGAHGEALAFSPDGTMLRVALSDARGTVLGLRVER